MVSRKYNNVSRQNLLFHSDRVCQECGKNYKGKGNQKYCSVLCSRRNDYSSNMLKHKWRIGKLLANAKGRSKDKNLEFNLTQQYLEELWEESEGRCSITGRSFDLTKYGEFGQVNPNAPSIDRIIPNKGYTIGNVRLVTYHINVALSEYGLESLVELIKDIKLKIKEYNGKEAT